MLFRLWTYRPAIAPSDMELRGAGDGAIPGAGGGVVRALYASAGLLDTARCAVPAALWL